MASAEMPVQEHGHELMETGTALRRVVRYQDVDWAELKSVGSNPLEFLRQRGVALYIQIDRDLATAWRHFKVPPPPPPFPAPRSLAGLPVMRFEPDLFFLRLCPAALDELIVSGRSRCKEFIAGGLALVPTDESQGPVLKDMDFERCYVVSNIVRTIVSEQIRAGQLTPAHYVQASEVLDLTPNDLWLSAEDLSEIRKGELTAGEMVEFPLQYGDQCPAIYWMFQAAYRANVLESWSIKEIGAWLREKAGRSVMTDDRRDTAAKFVKLKLDRRKGKHIAPFDLAAVGSEFEGVAIVDEPYLSDGMKLILAATKWWFDEISFGRPPSRFAFAKTLVNLNFRKAEAIDLTYLITAAGLDPDEKARLAKFAAA